LVKRPARLAPPDVPADKIIVAEPPKPQATAPAAGSAAMLILPLIGGSGSLMVAITNPNRPLFVAAGVLFLIASVAVGALMLFSMRSGPRKSLREKRERYLDYVEQLRHRLRGTVAAQKADGRWRHPDPGRLLDLARMDSRRWERRVADPDFLLLRGGLGDQPIRTTLTMSGDGGPLDECDPVCLDAANQLCARYAALRDQPVCVGLAGISVLSVVGDREPGRALAQALLAQLITMHAPEEVRLAVVRADAHADAWDWVKWLPHAQHPATMDGAVPARMVTTSVPAMAELLGAEIEARVEAHQRRRGQPIVARDHIVVVVDGEHLTGVWGLEPPERAITLADLGIHLVVLLGHRREEPESVDARLTVAAFEQAGSLNASRPRPAQFAEQAGSLNASRPRPAPFAGTAHQEWTGHSFQIDRVPDGLLPALARLCAPLRLVSEEPSDVLTSTIALPDILGVADVAELDLDHTWRPRPQREFLRVPVGVGSTGTAVMLDLKESAHGGMGPHGLIVGATGSGKSEMLRTLLTSLVIGHPPERLALMLVDFKGGATFAPMHGLPHIAGMVTNIEDDLNLVDRMRDALYGEMRRRQEILRAAGNLPNVSAYQSLRDAGEPLEPLPHLLVIIDEFSELLTAKPDFAELFVAIGRIGRSIGVHLLLATQRLEMGKIRGLESNLSYRISLRTFSEAESREAIGVPDAYHLMPEPGAGFLKVDTTVFERFKAALVSAPYTPPAEATAEVVPVVPYTALSNMDGWLPVAVDSDALPAPARAGQRTILDVAVDRIAGAQRQPTRPVWLEPLGAAVPLDQLQDPFATAPAGSLSATLGLVDDPSTQRQYPLDWDFTGGGGNLLVVGAPQSGKSTLLRTLICSMGLAYPPGDVAFYCIDYGGGGLAPLQDLPHVAGVATRADPERVRRTVAEVANAVNEREELFRAKGLDSPAALRAARLSGAVSPEVPGAMLLVIDGWGPFREDHELLEAQVGEIASRGLNYGVHVVLTLTQTMQVRMRMQPAFGGRIELRLNDAFDSSFDRKMQERIDKQLPGRGLLADNLLFHGALPRVDGEASLVDLTAAQKRLVATAAERWPRGGVPTVQVLPPLYPYRELPPAGDGPIPVGLSERNLRPAAVDLTGGDPHLLVYGDGESGKSNLLRVLLRGFQARYKPEELGIVVVDYRRSLLGVVPEEYALAYCTTHQKTLAVAQEVASSIAKRVPGPDLTNEQLRDRSWWQGLEVLVVVDDYDLVAASSGNPLLGLVDYLPQGRDLGLHLVLARRTGGLSRALFDPVIQRLNDLSTPGFLFSGDRMEGRLVNGVASQRLPAGRALYAMRGGGVQQIQVAWLPPE
jgi:S-DNA-T family DNA segregation ATPase FtsK/SpoIIIE